MSTRGRTQELITMPGDRITTANSGLTTIIRTYGCATSFADTAETILVPGYSPSDYPLTALQFPPARLDQSGITTFVCTFYGVLSKNQFYQYYDEVSSLVQRASYTWLDYYYQFVGDVLNQYNLSQDCTLTYAAPAITRTFVIPLSDPVKSVPPAVSQWSILPVLPMALDGPTSTVPLGTTVPSGQLLPIGQDLLSLYGYTIQINKFNATVYGACRLIELEYMKIWNGNKKIIQPYFHDPSNLQEGSHVAISLPDQSLQNITGMSFIVGTEEYDAARDGVYNRESVSGGTAPITIAFSGFTDYNTPFPFVGYYVMITKDAATNYLPHFGNSISFPPYELFPRTTITQPCDATQSVSWFNGTNSFTKLDPGTHVVNFPPGTYDVTLFLIGENCGDRDQFDHIKGMVKITETIKTRGAPGAPFITFIEDTGNGNGPGSGTKIYFTPPDNDGGSDIVSYNVYQSYLDNAITNCPVSAIQHGPLGYYIDSAAHGITAEFPLYLSAVNAVGEGALTPPYTGNH